MKGLPSDIEGIAACPDCDLLYREAAVSPGQKLRCSRCGSTLRTPVGNTLDKTIALSLTGLLLYIPAVTLPIMTISVLGFQRRCSVIDSMAGMFETGYPFVGFMIFLAGILFPLVKLALLFWVSLSLRTRSSSTNLSLGFRAHEHLSEWGMAEVYMLGILVSIIKVYDMGNLEFNLGFFCFSALFLITVGSSVVVDKYVFWELIGGNENPGKEPKTSPAFSDTTLTAREAGLIRCLDCGKVVRAVQTGPDEILRCPRCRAVVHSRKPGNISRTWALVISAFILFLPANIYPMMRVDFFGIPDNSTILDGIVYFFQSGEYLVGTIIFVASILVPLFKMVGLVLILLSIQMQWSGWLRHKAKMFRFVEFIGRWSFLDVFVIALLAAMIQFGALTSIAANPAARYFTAVVIVTMFAAIAFDPRTLWDSCAKTSETKKEQDG